MRFSSSLFFAGLLACCGAWAELALLPGDVKLTHGGSTHGLIVERSQDGRWAEDLTSGASYVSSSPAVATVDERGTVRAVSDGEATITATAGGESATATVVVSQTTQMRDDLFRNRVQPLMFKMGCNTGACHGAQAGKNGLKLSLRGFDNDWDHKSLTRAVSGRRVSLAEPEESLVLLKPTMGVAHEGGLRFEKGSEAYAILLEWIKAGAPPAHENDRRVERLELLPGAAALRNGAEQRLLVRAHYSDGFVEDVTRWTKFGTTDESVALVDESGRVTVKGPGAVSITAWYASKVASAALTVPREKAVAPEVYARAARNNYIDESVLRQLQELQIPPAGPASDAEFVRRAYLDAVGVLPTPAEAFGYVMDPAADKRSRLVDRLLERPEFVDYWAYKWSDLLLLSSKNLPRKEELTSFYRFIRGSVAENKPWDRFVSEIVTATGNTRENGAANYFAMHQEVVDITETTSQAFLGMSVTCARCHNHPLEKWTQDDYYGFANLFARVKLKNGKRGNDTEVLPATFGDVLHPRLGKAVAPKPLDGDPVDADAAGDRREALARWLTSSENPYFTRAIVNRVWRNFMGRGLVEPEDDLRLTNPATNEELMAAMAKDLAEHGYDLKHLIRTIMTSAAYGRTSAPPDPAAPDDKYYSHYIPRRLSAEVLLDVYSQVTNVPTEFPGYPQGYRALQLPDSQVGSYFLAAFGRPPRIQTCSCERTEDSSVAQTLHVANGETLNGKLRHEKSFIGELIAKGAGDDEAIEQIYIRSLSRYPTPDEQRQAREMLAAVPKEGETAAAERRLALEDLAWAVLSSKEFMFNH